MSVVNKMLQDLETRKKRSGLTADYVPNEPALFKPWMLGVSVAVIALAIILSQVNWQSESQLSMYSQQLPPAAFHSQKPLLVASTEAESEVNEQEIAVQADESEAPLEVTNIRAENTEMVAAIEPSPALIEAVDSPDSAKASERKTPLERAEIVVQKAKVEQTEAPVAEFSVAPSNGAKVGISSLREQARIALNDDDIKGALSALETLIFEYPEDIRARKQLASLLFSHHGVERAYQILKDGLVLTPADNAMRVMLARVAFKTGNYQDAHNALAEHPFPNLADVELISFRAALAERLSQYENAYEDYKLLVAREPRNAKWWLGLGVSQDKLKLVQPALESYRQAKDLKQLPTQVDTFVDQRIAALARQS
ncbi:tetratricopeptide repeat protein [Glaciecola sp. SC05]|uniref:tetratricopeptide repeat protein n=1 Tax=Glaciecola sp. SC05 TaxID=1987355 RepID=UPI003528CA3F